MEISEFECPICVRIPTAEIFQCENGHILCNYCIDQLTTCPQCRIPISEGRRSRNRFMEKVLDGYTFACPFADRGCTEKLERTAVNNHQDSCKFGVTFDICKFLGHEDCDFQLEIGNTAATVDHLKRKHSCRLIVERPNTTAFFMSFILKDFYKVATFEGVKSASWYYIMHNAGSNGKTFLIVSKVMGDRSSWACLDLDLGSTLTTAAPATLDKFDVSLTIDNEGNDIKSIRSLQWQLPIISGIESGVSDSLPFQISIPYLLKMSDNSTQSVLQMDLKFGSSPDNIPEARHFRLMPNVIYHK